MFLSFSPPPWGTIFVTVPQIYFCNRSPKFILKSPPPPPQEKHRSKTVRRIQNHRIQNYSTGSKTNGSARGSRVYFVGTRTARFSKNVIYGIGTKIVLLKIWVCFLTGKSRFWKRFWQPFLDLINSKDCTHEYKLLKFSDLKKVDKTF